MHNDNLDLIASYKDDLSVDVSSLRDVLDSHFAGNATMDEVKNEMIKIILAYKYGQPDLSTP